MRAIEESLLAIRPDLASGDSQSLGEALNRLETVGAELGSFQVRCCASVRMPLYAEALASINTVQLGIATELGLAH